MKFINRVTAAVVASVVVLAAGPIARAEEIPEKYRPAIKKGLEWVASQQKKNGQWDANNGQYPTTMTALGGMVLLMEGSTLREGKYSDNLRRAVDRLVKSAQPNGLIGDPNNPTEAQRYIYGHGYSMLFLASVYGEEEDADRRKKLEEVLTRAVEFSGQAQTSRGGWGYVSAKDTGGAGFDEGSTTITQVQGLRACRNAGIVVPKSIIDNAEKYLKDATTPKGGVIYSLANGQPVAGAERPPLTAAAIACMFSAGEYKSPLARKWLEFCKTNLPIGQIGRGGHDEYAQYYYAQSMYILGDDGYQKLYPDSAEADRLTWTKYREVMFKHIMDTQTSDGSWTGGYIGPIFASCVNLTILQLDKSTLPIYQR
jgi:hypothetical protein